MARESKTHPALAQLFDQIELPIYLIDAGRRIVFCNRALSDWLQMDPDRILGRIVEYHSEPESADPTTAPTARRLPAPPLTSLCPPPAALAGEEALGTLSCVDRKGHLLHRRGRFIPLHGSSSASDNGVNQTLQPPVLAVLDAHDLSSSELTRTLSLEPTADELHRIIRQFRRGRRGYYAIESLLGESSVIRKVRAQAAAAATSGANVLIDGRPGSGRTHVAKTIHYSSVEDDQATFTVLEGPLLSQDALRRAIDRLVELGTTKAKSSLLISVLDALDAEMQQHLIEALRRCPPNVRLMATINSERPKNAGEDDSTDDNHNDSYHVSPALLDTFATITIRMPRLVDRLEDLPILAHYFLESANRGQAKQIGGIRSAALERLALYNWPGELAELRQTITEAHGAASGVEIDVADLPAIIHHAAQAASLEPKEREVIVLDEFLGRIERELIERAMREASGNKTEAARLLGMTRARLYRRLVQLGLDDED